MTKSTKKHEDNDRKPKRLSIEPRRKSFKKKLDLLRNIEFSGDLLDEIMSEFLKDIEPGVGSVLFGPDFQFGGDEIDQLLAQIDFDVDCSVLEKYYDPSDGSAAEMTGTAADATAGGLFADYWTEEMVADFVDIGSENYDIDRLLEEILD